MNEAELKYLISLRNIATQFVHETNEYLKSIEPGEPQRQSLPPKKVHADDLINAFPDKYAELLEFSDTEEYVIIKAKQFLPRGDFAEIAKIIKEQLDGEYVSAGKDTHFRVRK